MVEFNKNIKKVALGATILTTLAGCANNNKVETTTTAKKAVPTETTTELTTENNAVNSILNVDDLSTVTAVAENSYNEYKEFYDKSGIGVEDIKDMILVINDKYETEDGFVLLDEERLSKAFNNIERIFIPTTVILKIDNINTINNPDAPEIEDGITIPSIPAVSDFIDMNIPGSEITSRKVQEFQNEISYQCNLMNATQNFDVDSINKFAQKIDVLDYNNDDSGLSGATNVTGHLFLLADSKKATLKICGQMNPQVNFIEGNKGLQDIKINYFNDERKREDLVENIKYEYGDTLDVNMDELNEYIIDSYDNGLYLSPEDIINAYGLNITEDEADLFIKHAIDVSTMADYKYERIECNEKKIALDTLRSIMKKYQGKGIKLTYTNC